MNVLIIGGGVVGVATAYFLSRAGMDVTVVESLDQAGLEASAGNAGLLSPSDAFSWASYSALQTAIKSLVNPDMGIKYKLQLDPQLWWWSLKFIAQCRHHKWIHNSDVKYRLAAYSLDMLEELRRDTKINFDVSDAGIVYASRDADSLNSLRKHYQFLQDRGLQLEMLNRDELLDKVPALEASKNPYAGAVYSPNCKTGNSAKFSQNLASWCSRNKNCHFYWGTTVERFLMDKNNRISGLWTSRGEMKADAYVLAAGAHSGVLAKQVGLHLPIYPVKGFSITAPVVNESKALIPGFDDTQRLVALSRIGNHLRIASSAVFDGFNKNHHPQDFQLILGLAREVFPDVADYDRAEYWSGLRPMTPSSVPILGPCLVSNLFLNVGHGHLGWTLACASGRIVADIMTGRNPEIPLSPYLMSGL